MKELLFHIGYPKTATSTLQNHLFTTLDEKKQINYLGRSNRGLSKFKAGEAMINELVFGLSNSKIDQCTLSDDVLNVISNEDVVLSFKNIIGNDVLSESDPTEVAEKLGGVLSHHDCNVKVLVTLRAQADLVHSFYVEGYKWHFRHVKSLDTFEKYIAQGLESKSNGVFLMFYYYEVIKSYVNVFGKDNVEILFYEDIRLEVDTYSKKLAELLSVEAGLVKNVLLNKNDNVKSKVDKGSYTNALSLDQILVDVFRIILPKKFFIGLKGNKVVSSMVGQLGKYLKKYMVGRAHLIPNLDVVQREIILNEFSSSNTRLIEEFNLDRGKMKKYGYIG
ncbi:MAG: sulfotransferase domain-containing protein [Cycloclasticus sp.]|uniref:sulfotransferase domain-containing protein n=1 Tax=Cycloclasticus sp. TaxID=2024830 RepID=UPI00257A8ED1|nr:sulfotransferase domain-containing protein [Cycloclasticus sp.]MBV1899520.1 sulfotransferase domain-containing protein [Cycloclasticus sp.]